LQLDCLQTLDKNIGKASALPLIEKSHRSEDTAKMLKNRGLSNLIDALQPEARYEASINQRRVDALGPMTQQQKIQAARAENGLGKMVYGLYTNAEGKQAPVKTALNRFLGQTKKKFNLDWRGIPKTRHIKNAYGTPEGAVRAYIKKSQNLINNSKPEYNLTMKSVSKEMKPDNFLTGIINFFTGK